MVDACKLQRWQAKYGDALHALPDNVRQKFVRGPNEANEALAEGAAAWREALIAHSKLDVAMMISTMSSIRHTSAWRQWSGRSCTPPKPSECCGCRFAAQIA